MQKSYRAAATWTVVAALSTGAAWSAQGGSAHAAVPTLSAATPPVAAPPAATQPSLLGAAKAAAARPAAANPAPAGGAGGAGDEKPATDSAVEGSEKPIDATFAWQTLTRQGQVNLDSGQVTYSINMQGSMVVPAGSKFLTATNEVVVTEALDQDGASMIQTRPDIARAMGGMIGRRNVNFNNFGGMGMMGGGMRPPVFINLPQITGKPTAIKSLKGYGTIMVAAKQQIKVIDAVANNEYQKLAEGCELKVDSISLQPGGGNLTITVRKAGDPQRGYQAMWDAPVIQMVELVDDQGNATQPQYLNQNFAGNDGGKVLFRLQPYFNPNGRALQNTKTIRLTIATKVKEQQVPFTLKDVPLP